jgi:hypothetical protein
MVGDRGCRAWRTVLIFLTACAPLGLAIRVPGQLDPTLYGFANDTSTSRVVLNGQDLYATVSDVTVSTIILNGASSLRILQPVFLHALKSRHSN